MMVMSLMSLIRRQVHTLEEETVLMAEHAILPPNSSLTAARDLYNYPAKAVLGWGSYHLLTIADLLPGSGVGCPRGRRCLVLERPQQPWKWL